MARHVPFQVQLTPVQHRRLRQLAEQRDASMGSIVRESVTAYLAGLPIEDDPALGIGGLVVDEGPTPYGDVAREHDAYLADATEAEATDRDR